MTDHGAGAAHASSGSGARTVSNGPRCRIQAGSTSAATTIADGQQVNCRAGELAGRAVLRTALRHGLGTIALAYLVALGGYFAAVAWGLARSGWLAAIRELTPYLFLPIPVLLLAALLWRARLALALVMPPLVLFAGIFGPRLLPAPAAAAEQSAFRVLSFNVATGRGRGQPEPIIRLARAAGADLVCLQEVRADTLDVVGAALRDEYPYQAGSSDGVILSRGPILEARPYQPRTGAHEGLLAEVTVGDRVVTIVNAHLWLASGYATWRREGLHLARGYDTERRNLAAAELVERLRATGGPRVLVGDFNMTP